ncbi:MAG: GDP-mannose 4,6-dehydratase, partial [Candidatus Omnitrophica bacterium]|nr:GDP-mannose 4,6-dehydratase [Candidatus Omnitrophota bacterium]
MIEIKSLLVNDRSTLREALKITSRVLKTAFVVGDNGRFLGVITDGDIRRALIAHASMEDPVIGYYNKDAVFMIGGKLNKTDFNPGSVHIIPIIDSDYRVAGYKTPKELKKVAFVAGVTGQDGAYLAYFLLKKGYMVVGGYRRTSVDSFERLKRLGIADKIMLESFDITDISSIIQIIEKYEPAEIYNLAAQSFVHISFSEPYSTTLYTGLSVLNFLEAIRLTDSSIRFYQASSSEMFGNNGEVVQSENAAFKPSSPYATAKVFGHMTTRNYSDCYGIFACSGIMFNHESPLR